MAPEKFPLIVFCGMDGSGKSTLARRLGEALAVRGIESVILHGHAYAASANSFGVGEERIRKFRWCFRLLLPLAWLDHIYSYFRRYRPLLRARAVISDRYFYDKAARLLYFRICGKSSARRYVHSLPRPSHLFFLDVPEETAAARKDDYRPEQLRRFRKIYRYLAGVLDAPVLDATAEPEQNLKIILGAMALNGPKKEKNPGGGRA